MTRNFIWNLLGFGLPLVLAVFAIPALTERAGLARFGFLAIAWALIGYLGFLDLGLSRVFARRVAIARATGTLAAEAATLRRACTVTFVGTTVLALLLVQFVPVDWLIRGSAGVPESELRLVWWVLLAALPPLVVANLLRGAMEGFEAFGVVNALRIGFGAWTFGGPLLVLAFTTSLPWLVFSLTFGRWVALALHAWWCVPRLSSAMEVDPARPAPLWPALHEGLWMTVTNAVGSAFVVIDRFVLAALVGLAAVSSYAIAQELALRLLLVPVALAATLFPRQAALALDKGNRAAGHMTDRASRIAVAMMIPLSCAGLIAAEPVLGAWLGTGLAAPTAFALSILLIGVTLYSGAQIPFGMLQAMGHARTTGLIHLAQLPVYVAALWLAVDRLGVIGAAAVWVIRLLVETIAVVVLARRVQPGAFGLRAMVGTFGGAAAVLAFCLWPSLKWIAVFVAIGAPLFLIRRDEWRGFFERTGTGGRAANG